MDEEQRIKVFIVDDHFVVRMGLASVITTQPDMQLVGEAGNAQQALELLRNVDADVVLVDLRLPQVSGIELIRQVRQTRPRARCVVLTSFGEEENMHRAVRAGAYGFLRKDALHEDLLTAIRAVSAGRHYLPTPSVGKAATGDGSNALTRRELDVLAMFAKGKNNQQIALELDITEHTVKNHVKGILRKLGCADRTQALVIALRRGLVGLD